MLKSKGRPRDFKQPFYPDAASQILLAGVGTLVSLSSEDAVRQHESDNALQPFDQVFGVRFVPPIANVRLETVEFTSN